MVSILGSLAVVAVVLVITGVWVISCGWKSDSESRRWGMTVLGGLCILAGIGLVTGFYVFLTSLPGL